MKGKPKVSGVEPEGVEPERWGLGGARGMPHEGVGPEVMGLLGVGLEGWSLSPTEGSPEMEASPPEVGFPRLGESSKSLSGLLKMAAPCANNVEAPIIIKLDLFSL